MYNDIGIIGLGVMGSNLALNIAEKKFHVAVYNRGTLKMQEFINLQSDKPWKNFVMGYDNLSDFVASIKPPRKVMILVKAGEATDTTIEALTKVLSLNDIIIDTGNAHFKDQSRRAKELEKRGFRFLAMGISGGEEGARKGPAFFPGGTMSVWEEIRPIVEAAAAKADDGSPCVTMNGSDGAGSCVKMYHNAGEYAILQIWAEAYEIMSASGLSNDDIVKVFEQWKGRGLLESYMLNISIEVAHAKEDGDFLIKKIMDCIGSKGTGLWSAQEALEIGCPAPSLNMAVIARQQTMAKQERLENSKYTNIFIKAPHLTWNSSEIEDLYSAVLLGIIASYAQMFQCLREQDKVYKFGLNLPNTIATFRAGCILQGFLLKPMTEAFRKNKNLPNLLCGFISELNNHLEGYRKCIGYVSSQTAVSISVLSASLYYINAMFSPILKYGQFVALQRDVFGRHGFERLDKEGKSSHDWPELQ